VKGDNEYETNMPRIKYEPVVFVLMKIFTQHEIILNKEKNFPDNVAPPGFGPPLKIFKAGFSVERSILRDHRINFRPEVGRQPEIFHDFYGVHQNNENIPHVCGNRQRNAHLIPHAIDFSGKKDDNTNPCLNGPVTDKHLRKIKSGPSGI
jgi:hypothetical protein